MNRIPKPVRALFVVAAFLAVAFLIAQVVIGVVATWFAVAVSGSHIEGNLPVRSEFHIVLGRDLTGYFEKREQASVRVTYQMLRDGPTQVGLSYPKYYIWVEAKRSDGRVIHGPARLAAVDGVKSSTSSQTASFVAT